MDSWRLALLGDGGVGKTALAVQFCLNAFTYDPTIEDAYRKATKVGPQRCFIEIIDTAGQEEYAPVRDQWTWETAAFVLVFSIGSYKSFDRLKLFYNIVTRVQRKDPIVIVVGNKLDQKRVVPAQAGIEFARSIKATYIETSAKTAHNVPLVFTEPITRLR
ncbi:ras protein, partial [Clavulina sp. PMI_390]